MKYRVIKKRKKERKEDILKEKNGKTKHDKTDNNVFDNFVEFCFLSKSRDRPKCRTCKGYNQNGAKWLNGSFVHEGTILSQINIGQEKWVQFEAIIGPHVNLTCPGIFVMPGTVFEFRDNWVILL